MNYEEKYKNALERAKSFCKRWDGLKIDSSSLVIQEVKEFFPELDNIEDEIMRENLYKCLRCYVPNDKAEEFIAWLERQGEQKPFPKQLDADKVVEWLNDQACLGWIEDIEVEKFVEQFKKDFEL